MLLTSMWLISVIYHMHYILLHLYYGIAFSGNQRQYIKQRLQLKANAGNTWHSTGQFLNMFQHVLLVFFMEIGSSKRTSLTNIMCQAGSLTKHVKLSMAKSSMTNYDILGPKYDSLQNQNILCRNYDFTSLYAKTTIFYGQTTAQLALHQDNGKWCFVLSNIHHFWKPVVWWKKNFISIWVSFIPLVAYMIFGKK